MQAPAPSSTAVIPTGSYRSNLAQLPLSMFGIPLGFGAQAVLYSMLNRLQFPFFDRRVGSPIEIVWVLWFLCLGFLVVIAGLYVFKLLRHRDIVAAELNHPALCNFMFAPLLCVLFLCISAPPEAYEPMAQKVIWGLVFLAQLSLSLYLAGYWLYGPKLSMASIQVLYLMSVVGWLLLGNMAGHRGYAHWGEWCFFVGSFLWLLVLFSIFQRGYQFNGENRNTAIVFLFIAPPSAACVAWFNIQGKVFTNVSEVYWAIGGFFYLLTFRIWLQFVRGASFTVVWWAATFPLSSYATATTLFATHYDNWFTRTLNFFAVVISSTAVIVIATRTAIVIARRGFASLLPKPAAQAQTDSTSGSGGHSGMYELPTVRSVAETLHGAPAAPF